MALLTTVSIHAPAWGATFSITLIHLFIVRFNPRPRVGGDLRNDDIALRSDCFNPRPRVGGDDYITGLGAAFVGFNPRPRVGGDH